MNCYELEGYIGLQFKARVGNKIKCFFQSTQQIKIHTITIHKYSYAQNFDLKYRADNYSAI